MRSLRVFGMVAVAALGAATLAQAKPGDTLLVSAGISGTVTASGHSSEGAFSADDRFIVFSSAAADLVRNDTNLRGDVFIRNLATGLIERVSVSSTSVQGNSDSYGGVVSATGRYVAFSSSASNLDGPDYNEAVDVFVRDRQTGRTERVSRRADSGYTNDASWGAQISGDGRYVAFSSIASDLIGNESKGTSDVYVRDRQAAQTVRVSLGADGVRGNGASVLLAMTPDARFIVFSSDASNLVPDDTNAATDIFVRDRQTGTTERVSLGVAGQQANARSNGNAMVSSDGRFIAFVSRASNLVAGDVNDADDVFVRDRVAGVTERVTVRVAEEDYAFFEWTYLAGISADGRYVLFHSYSEDLVPEGGTGSAEIFVRDRFAGVTRRLTRNPGTDYTKDSYATGMSPDGRLIAFNSVVPRFVPHDGNGDSDVFVLKLADASITVASTTLYPNELKAAVACCKSSVSADGRYVAFESESTRIVLNDENYEMDVFLRDTRTGLTQWLSPSYYNDMYDSPSTSPVITPDGKLVVFDSWFPGLVPGPDNQSSDIFAYQRETGVTELVSVSAQGSPANGSSVDPSVSADGRYVSFSSDATNLLAGGDTNQRSDIYVRDRVSGRNERISTSSSGVQANSYSTDSSISGNGRLVAFYSMASNLVPGDTNAYGDIFVKDRQTGTTERINVSSAGTQANAAAFYPSISADGRFVVFFSDATNLVAGDTNEVSDVFVRDRQAGTTERISVTNGGLQANGPSVDPFISADGRTIAYESFASNLIAGDGNGAHDVFVWDRLARQTKRMSVSTAGLEANGASFIPSVSADGRFVAFNSLAGNLASTDLNGEYDVYVHERTLLSYRIDPTSVVFGNQGLNTPVTRTLTLTNTGNAALTISGVTLSGADRFQYSFTRTCGSLVPVGASCSISVTFRPTSTANKTASLNVNGGSAGITSVALSGTGVAAAPNFTVTPTNLAFADQGRGTSSQALVVQVRNTGNTALAAGSIGLSGVAASQFTQTNTCRGSIAVGATCQINVIFKPSGTGVKVATLTVRMGNAGVKTIALSGTGVVTSFALTPTSLAFADQARNTASAARIVTLRNTGTAPLPITSLALTGSVSQYVLSTTCGASVAPGAQCTASIVFRPTSAGVKTAILTARVGGGAANGAVSLTGTGK